MFDFMRNKVVDVARLDRETLEVHGILDDSIYSLELCFKVNISDLICSGVKGRWLRWTTPECPRAIDFLHEAEGFCLKAGIDNKIHKTIGRKSCRHFANLFIECGHAVRETVKLLNWEAAQKENPEITFKQFMRNDETASMAESSPGMDNEKKELSSPSGTNKPSPKKTEHKRNAGSLGNPSAKKGKFVIDMHVHTSPASPCASDSVDAMIQEARRIGLQGICLTDHNYVWSAEAVQALSEKHDFLVLRANEIITEQGDILTFGFYENLQGITRLADLKKKVADVGGFIVAAHPFRGFLTFGADDVGLTPDSAMARELFKWVDGVETLNGKVTETENNMARDVANGLGLPSTGGSDAHDISTVGVYATAFDEVIDSEASLLAALKQGKYHPVVFR
ncbi:Predicted metal-dependent phosphoesterase TrpH, contains PHP domain [Desulfocicer vacuolatum DSM 3385]|uniref:Predicted metal-dependent phosphoesterase TrpH, contains PHP domain n=1 Tax=Desulfocicer vacuolatum DSM 3385 TaxID=1121400 RepID=A0A1W2C167_9BACT|nr:PHP domain-containing protein [Desulfocicer vacuolatum]SMC78831.1 Predicted metal-dependent phosphoesterase TrpH, contains PHP domain [Desulfocicer vacuolatum DSM 3385]